MAANREIKAEIKKIVGQIKSAQKQFQGMVKDKTWLEDARKYAEQQGKGIKTLLAGDLTKVKAFLDKERKELDKFQKQIPGEIKKFKSYVHTQKKELEKLLKNVKKAGAKSTKGGKKSSAPRKAKASKKASATATSPSPSSVPVDVPSSPLN